MITSGHVRHGAALFVAGSLVLASSTSCGVVDAPPPGAERSDLTCSEAFAVVDSRPTRPGRRAICAAKTIRS